MMSEHDVAGEVLERLEWHDSKQEQTPELKSRAVTRRVAIGGGAGALAAIMLSPVAQSWAASSSSVFGPQKKYKFVFVNHVTTNPFFTPTQNGIADACALLGCTSQWTGSTSSNVPQMVTAFNSAITAGANGIACCMIDPKAFTGPTAEALAKGIPVLAYNADEPNGRLAYIGQDLFVSGQQMGQVIAKLVPAGDVALFIATPGSANIQPRIDGAISVLKKTKLKYKVVATGAALPQELSTIESFWTGHTNYQGMFAVDGGSTQSVFQTIQKYKLRSKGIKGGGYDLTPITQQLLAAGQGDFTIDQQPYLQGFLPLLELFLWQVSGSLTGPAEVDTGLKFLNKETVAPYVNSKSRFEGTSSEAKVVPIPAGTPA
jgi:simple sugar transport system substrate-binding protein